jgi:hypothetical protein
MRHDLRLSDPKQVSNLVTDRRYRCRHDPNCRTRSSEPRAHEGYSFGRAVFNEHPMLLGQVGIADGVPKTLRHLN